MMNRYDAEDYREAVREIVNLELEAISQRSEQDYLGAIDSSMRATNLRFAMRFRAFGRQRETAQV